MCEHVCMCFSFLILEKPSLFNESFNDFRVTDFVFALEDGKMALKCVGVLVKLINSQRDLLC